MGNPLEKIKEYVIGIGIKKAANATVKVFVGLLGSAKVIAALTTIGVTATAAPDGKAFTITIAQATFISALVGGIFFLANYLKRKFNINWI
jgi:uncharacterized membrane protein